MRGLCTCFPCTKPTGQETPRKLSKKPVLITDLRTLLSARANHSSKGHKTPYQHESTIRRLTRNSQLSANWQHRHWWRVRIRGARAAILIRRRRAPGPQARVRATDPANDWTERAANTRQPLRDHQTPPPRPRTAKGQRHDYHEGRIQWGSHTQCESGRRRDGVNLRRRLREPDAQRRR